MLDTNWYKHKLSFALSLLLLVLCAGCVAQPPPAAWGEAKSASEFGNFDFASLFVDTYPDLQPALAKIDETLAVSRGPYAKGDLILMRNRIKDKGNPYEAAQYYLDYSKHADTPLKKSIANLSLYSIEMLYGKTERRTEAIEQARAFKPWLGEAIEGKAAFSAQDIQKVKPPGKPIRITIGSTSIVLKTGDVVKCQSERVVRDWLSIYNLDLPPWGIEKERIVPWHEGARIKELMDLVDIKVLPVTGTLVKRQGDKWFAPDMDGQFKYEVSLDKVYNYPTNKIIDKDTVLIVDTHGISSLAWDAEGARLVVGCGDHKGKADAAYYLASKGIDVYTPPDRFIYTLIGTKTPGKILGSAPIKKHPQGAMIGGQPITMNVGEKTVVSTTTLGYPVQYYDTPYRYFKALEEYYGVSFNLQVIDIREVGETVKVVTKAGETGARLIGVRVYSEEEYKAVAEWLRKDKGNRAVLFHSSLYAPGYRLFAEFPKQTSFGDIYPIMEFYEKKD